MLLSQQIQNVNIKTIVQKHVEKNLYQTAHEKQFEKGLKLHRRANIISFSCISFLHFPFEFFFWSISFYQIMTLLQCLQLILVAQCIVVQLLCVYNYKLHVSDKKMLCEP